MGTLGCKYLIHGYLDAVGLMLKAIILGEGAEFWSEELSRGVSRELGGPNFKVDPLVPLYGPRSTQRVHIHGMVYTWALKRAPISLRWGLCIYHNDTWTLWTSSDPSKEGKSPYWGPTTSPKNCRASSLPTYVVHT